MRNWTEYEISELKKLQEQGFLVEYIAFHLNRSVSSVRNKILELRKQEAK